MKRKQISAILLTTAMTVNLLGMNALAAENASPGAADSGSKKAFTDGYNLKTVDDEAELTPEEKEALRALNRSRLYGQHKNAPNVGG